jgi:hypothetical protein
MRTEGGERSRSHGLARELLEADFEAVIVAVRDGAWFLDLGGVSRRRTPRGSRR